MNRTGAGAALERVCGCDTDRHTGLLEQARPGTQDTAIVMRNIRGRTLGQLRTSGVNDDNPRVRDHALKQVQSRRRD